MRWRLTRTGRGMVAGVASGALLLTGIGIAEASSPPSGTVREAGAAAATQVQAPVPVISWHVCGDNPRLRCGTAKVPLDYDLPNGATISLNIVKRPADVASRKIGSLFVNPGGPGGSAADFVGYAASVLGAPVRQRFDVIGVDPRGIAGSTVVSCVTKPGDPPLPPEPEEAFPRGERQIGEWFTWDDAVRETCARGGNPVLDHMTTADTARDMDLIRQAVHDPMLNYYGISYGSVLGSTYAAMFPSRVRALIVDGILDPVQWTVGRFGLGERYTVSARLGSGYGAWEALTSALSECDRVGPRFCPEAGSIGHEWNLVAATLHAGPVRVQGGVLTYANVHGTLLGGLYDAAVYPEIMDFIHQLYQLIFEQAAGSEGAAGRAWQRLTAAVAASGPSVPRYGVGSRGVGAAGQGIREERIVPEFQGVTCSDSVNPDDPSRAIPSARYANIRGPGFGALWAWASSQCTAWPGSSADAFRGPWRTHTAKPILITGNIHDPATPISGARALNKLFFGSRMLTVDTWGHGALGHSLCALRTWDDYLVRLRLPAPGLVCQPNGPLFPG